MHSGAMVIGYVSDVIVDEKTVTLIVEDRTGEKVRSTACRCWSEKAKGQAMEIKPGSLVKVDGYIGSNRSTQGKWFTDFSPTYIKVISGDSGEF